MPRKYSKKRAPRAKRRYRRKGYAKKKRGTVSKRRILDVATIKKRDTMRIGVLQSNGTVLSSGIRGQPYVVPGASFHAALWCPSYREYNNSTNSAARARRSVFLKGLAEKMRFETPGASAFEFRRIVFSTPQRVLLAAGAPSTDQPPVIVEGGANRYWRAWGDGQTNVDYLDLVFSGARQIDWLNPMTAKTDTRRVKILSDRRFKIASGNQNATVKEMRFYTPLNRNITYDDDENGGLYTTSGWAQYAVEGTMQNVYVLTLTMTVGTTDQTPSVDSEATLYWHER